MRSPPSSGRAARRCSTWAPAARPRSTTPTTRARWPSGCRAARDRKSTRLNSSHSQISYAVFCLKKKKNKKEKHYTMNDKKKTKKATQRKVERVRTDNTISQQQAAQWPATDRESGHDTGRRITVQ